MRGSDFDRWITGNYGEDQFRDTFEYPDDAICEPCEGSGELPVGEYVEGQLRFGCKACNGTGLNPEKKAQYDAKYQKQAEAEADAEYAAYMESVGDEPEDFD